MNGFTEEQAKKLHESKFWESMSHRERAVFQMNTPRLCMPFGIFHEAVEKTLGRGVFTHEFGLNVDGLRKELAGEQPPPSFADILAMIPADKLVIVVGG
jgi:hypothetical protein